MPHHSRESPKRATQTHKTNDHHPTKVSASLADSIKSNHSNKLKSSQVVESKIEDLETRSNDLQIENDK